MSARPNPGQTPCRPCVLSRPARNGPLNIDERVRAHHRQQRSTVAPRDGEFRITRLAHLCPPPNRTAANVSVTRAIYF